MPHANKEVRIAYHKAYYLMHREKQAARMKALYEARRDALGKKPRRLTPEQRARRQEEKRAYRKAYRAKNLAQIKERQKLYYQENKGQVRLRQRAYYETHSELYTTFASRHRARKAQSPRNDFTAAQWTEIKALWHYRCAYCGLKTTPLCQDHITPLSKGGSHTASNIVPACRSCNSTKRVGPPLTAVQPVFITLAASRQPSEKETKNDNDSHETLA